MDRRGQEKCAEMEEEHLLEKSRMKQAITDNFDAKIINFWHLFIKYLN